MPRKLVQIDHAMLCKTIRIFEFQEKKYSAHDLADDLQIAILTSWRWCRALHAYDIIHICDWRQDKLGRYQTPVYGWGNKLDKPKPRKTNLDRRLEYERRKEERKQARAEKKAKNDSISNHNDKHKDSLFASASVENTTSRLSNGAEQC